MKTVKKTTLKKDHNQHQTDTTFITFKTLFLFLENTFHKSMHAGARVAESEVFGWSKIPNIGSGSRIFCLTPTLAVQLDQFLHHTPKLGNPVELVHILLKLLLKQISCCVPWFPLISTAKFHSLDVNSLAAGLQYIRTSISA